MGCNIHIVLERKRKLHGNCWVGVRLCSSLSPCMFDSNIVRADVWRIWSVLENRNYDFFNDLCGVRGGGSSFGYEPKGFPEDASSLSVDELANDDDLHSHSWLSLDELKPVLEKHFATMRVVQKLESGETFDVLDLVDHNINRLAGEDYEFRLVFAFDN